MRPTSSSPWALLCEDSLICNRFHEIGFRIGVERSRIWRKHTVKIAVDHRFGTDVLPKIITSLHCKPTIDRRTCLYTNWYALDQQTPEQWDRHSPTAPTARAVSIVDTLFPFFFCSRPLFSFFFPIFRNIGSEQVRFCIQYTFPINQKLPIFPT